MKQLLNLIFLTLLTISSHAATPANEQSQAIAVITQAANSLQTLQCDFVQTKHLRMLDDEVVAKGKMYYKAADKLRWEYSSPYVYSFVLNSSQVKITKGNRFDVIDVNQSKVFKEIARIMMNSVVGKSLTDERNFSTSINTTAAEYIATLIPLRGNLKAMFQSIVLHFDRKKNIVSQVELTEKNGDTTIIRLTNTRVNGTIDQKLFAIE